jgi:hypothetical protein
MEDPTQRDRQGAIVTQEWRPGRSVTPEASFTAADVPDDVDLSGMMHVLFACFGGGCPKTDNYPAPGAVPKQLAANPMVSRLCQRLLTKGALAVIAHIDRAWNYSFQSGSGLPQTQVLRSVIETLMLGWPAGLATDPVSLQWGTLAAQLGMQIGPTAPTAPPPATLANLVIARDDARNYALFGDPAARLRVKEMI